VWLFSRGFVTQASLLNLQETETDMEGEEMNAV